jgi:hypothetical protein
MGKDLSQKEFLELIFFSVFVSFGMLLIQFAFKFVFKYLLG